MGKYIKKEIITHVSYNELHNCTTAQTYMGVGEKCAGREKSQLHNCTLLDREPKAQKKILSRGCWRMVGRYVECLGACFQRGFRLHLLPEEDLPISPPPEAKP